MYSIRVAKACDWPWHPEYLLFNLSELQLRPKNFIPLLQLFMLPLEA